MKIVFLMVSMFLVSCTTTGNKPEVLDVKAVSVGDTLYSVEPSHEDCTLVVANIMTLTEGRNGVETIPAVVCGMAECPISVPGVPATATCAALSAVKKAK